MGSQKEAVENASQKLKKIARDSEEISTGMVKIEIGR